MNDADRAAIDRFLDGDMPSAEWEAIQPNLETDPEAIEYLADRAILVSDLRRSLKRRRLQRDVMAVVDGDDQRGRAIWRRSPWIWAAAAMLLIGLTLPGVLSRRAGHRAGVTVEITDCQEATPAQDWQVGKRTELGRFVLASGRLGMRLPSGVMLDLAGPLEAEFVSPSELRLIRGKAIADVGDLGKGFVVETARARVVDLGTRFGVAVGATSETDVVVFDGKVEVFDPSAKAAPQQAKITLVEGEAIRVGDLRKPQRVKMVTLGGNARSFLEDGRSDVVEDVRDNVAAGDSHRYYGLLRGGMGEGARLYTTGHNRTWHAMPGRSFPKELAGADVICTFSSDRREENLEITLEIRQPCDLYVLVDARTVAPSWLREGFVNTGLRLRSGPWTPRASLSGAASDGVSDDAFVPHAVWKKTILQPGPMVLGSQRLPETSGPQVMYGIAVRKLSSR